MLALGDACCSGACVLSHPWASGVVGTPRGTCPNSQTAFGIDDSNNSSSMGLLSAAGLSQKSRIFVGALNGEYTNRSGDDDVAGSNLNKASDQE